jgi:hypothetical protein
MSTEVPFPESMSTAEVPFPESMSTAEVPTFATPMPTLISEHRWR